MAQLLGAILSSLGQTASFTLPHPPRILHVLLSVIKTDVQTELVFVYHLGELPDRGSDVIPPGAALGVVLVGLKRRNRGEAGEVRRYVG